MALISNSEAATVAVSVSVTVESTVADFSTDTDTDTDTASATVLNTSGQTTFEYILILTVVVAAYFIISKGLATLGVGTAILSPIQKNFANAYKNGHPKALGVDDPGGPFKHPRATGPQSFRIFINPEGQAGGGG